MVKEKIIRQCGLEGMQRTKQLIMELVGHKYDHVRIKMETWD